MVPKALYKDVGFDEWQTTSPGRLVKGNSIILLLNCASSGLNSEIQIPKNNTWPWIFFRECWVISQFCICQGRTHFRAIRWRSSQERECPWIRSAKAGICCLRGISESGRSLWASVILHRIDKAEMAFVWEVIQETAVLFIYSSRLVSKVGVHASQRLTKDIIWGLGRKY